MFIAGRFDSALLIVVRIVEIRLEPARYGDARIVEASHEELKRFLVVQANTKLAMQLADDLNYLRGIAHREADPFQVRKRRACHLCESYSIPQQLHAPAPVRMTTRCASRSASTILAPTAT